MTTKSNHNRRLMYINGMTLVETLVTLSIFLVIMSAVVTFEVNVFLYQRSIYSSFDNTQSSSLLIRHISKALRNMSPSVNGEYPLIAAGTSTVSFFSDVDGDGNPEQVTYTPEGSTNDLSFQYFNSSYDPKAGSTSQAMPQPIDIGAVRFIQVFLPPYSAFIELRNLKTNI